MPSPHPPQVQGARVGLPCGPKRAIPGYEAATAGQVSGRDWISNQLIDLCPTSPAQCLSSSGVSGSSPHGRQKGQRWPADGQRRTKTADPLRRERFSPLVG